MRKSLLLLSLVLPAATVTALAQAPILPSSRGTLLLGIGRAYQTNYGWPGTSAFAGYEYRLSDRSLFSVQPRLGSFWADTRSLEPDKQPGEKYAAGIAEALVAVRTSRRPERLAFRAEVGPALFVGREVTLYRYPGTYLNQDGTTTTLKKNQYQRHAIRNLGFTLGVGVDVTLQEQLYLGAGIESRTYSYFPGDILSASLRLGYVLR